ncbi:MAG: SDR family oxidoreductase [Thermoplasmata archaeon]|uniref:SDR family oxidoreductase n=1 Tax=Candidatus Sysuiplasma superficiale TaxID=2823368 RepID=A0A8J8CDY2_9ARCH|nr:SDR family oxidoreductase [Candidatus Sysuiplasma superficiale]MBX8645054.1 SDR family oxidoreductase [Candidatus Sysuiplasma superficiale]
MTGLRLGEGGSIIDISSRDGILPEGDVLRYKASKAGTILLSKALAIEPEQFSIRGNSVCMGFIPMDIHREANEPAKRIGGYIRKNQTGGCVTPDEVSCAALFLASDEVSFPGGTEIIVDGRICKE